MRLLVILEAGRQDFLNAINTIPPEHASVKPNLRHWSVLECIEHVVTFEDRYLSWLSSGTAIAPQRDPDKELRLFTTIRSRLHPLEAPEATRPRDRFRALPEALAAFQAVRTRSLRVVEESGETLYSIGIRHPYFGSVNGAELIHLIDGHARRHADQIRDTGEMLRTAPEVRRKPATPRQSGVFKRDEPDLPAELACPEDPDHSVADGESVRLQEVRLQHLQRPRLAVHTFRVDGCVLEKAQLQEGQFGSAIWKDVRFIDCDLANIRAHRLSLVRVEFINCRLTGLSATASDWHDVLIRHGEVRYAQLPGARFRACEFDECNWQEADLQQAALAGSVFRSCRLSEADLRAAKLQNTDFRGSELEGMVVEMNDLRGAIVTPAQAMVLARVLGLQIR